VVCGAALLGAAVLLAGAADVVAGAAGVVSSPPPQAVRPKQLRIRTTDKMKIAVLYILISPPVNYSLTKDLIIINKI
jgi:hypothetical protein